LGLAVLTRPATQSVLVLGVAVGAAFFLVRQVKPGFLAAVDCPSWKSARGAGLAVLAGVFLCILPVLRHNMALGAGWVLSTNNEWNCLLGNNPYTPCYKTWHLGEVRGMTPEVRAYVSQFQGKGVPRSAMVWEAIRNICRRPDLFALRTTNRVRAFWGADYHATCLLTEIHGRRALPGPLLAEAGGYCLLMFLVIAGLFFSVRAMDVRCVWFLIAIVLAYQLPYALTHCNGAYHAAVIGLLFPFAGAALDEAQFGKKGGWPALFRNKWFWIAVAAFIFVQIEYAYWVFLYH
jgi:hypothetical protein